MRTTSLLLSASVGAVVAFGVSTGAAWAAPTPSAPESPAASASPSATAGLEPGFVSVSAAAAAPGDTVRVSGTCPTASTGAALPVVQSVTSPAFAGPERFSKTDPMAFDGTATIADNTEAGNYPVVLTCSNGTAATSITVLPASAPSRPATPGPAAGGNATTGADGGVVVVDEQPAGVPWGWITAGGLVLVGGAAGSAYLISRRGRRDDDHDDTPARRDRLSV